MEEACVHQVCLSSLFRIRARLSSVKRLFSVAREANESNSHQSETKPAIQGVYPKYHVQNQEGGRFNFFLGLNLHLPKLDCARLSCCSSKLGICPRLSFWLEPQRKKHVLFDSLKLLANGQQPPLFRASRSSTNLRASLNFVMLTCIRVPNSQAIQSFQGVFLLRIPGYRAWLKGNPGCSKHH